MAVAADRLLLAGLVVHARKAAGRGEERAVLKGQEFTAERRARSVLRDLMDASHGNLNCILFPALNSLCLCLLSVLRVSGLYPVRVGLAKACGTTRHGRIPARRQGLQERIPRRSPGTRRKDRQDAGPTRADFACGPSAVGSEGGLGIGFLCPIFSSISPSYNLRR